MIRNFFITAIRNLRRNKKNSTTNILGLAIGMASALLTVSFQSVKAAMANQAKSLRSE
jgi:putative ABC transport system permease protein